MELSEEGVAHYRRHGFVRVPGVLSAAEAAGYARAAAELPGASSTGPEMRAFRQYVNVWRTSAALRALTLHPKLSALAHQLAGVPLRLWHDQVLVKPPHHETATEFHQDHPYWPHRTCRHALSAWVALVDVPAERGCMTFLPGSHTHTGLRPQDLHKEGDLFEIDPELRWSERVTVPLRAGDITFHNSYTGHMALPNRTDAARLAHVVIYMDADTVYDGRPHPVTDGVGLLPGDRLDGDLFPPLTSAAAGSPSE
ncbi:phytanoyl-CoA dioxygenase family protein [Streptomyces sp. NPDC002990]